MYCPYCGAELPDNSVFCKKCGKKLPVVENTEPSKENSTSSNEGTGTFIPDVDECIHLSTSGVNINDVLVGLHLTNKRLVIYSDTGILGEFALTSIVRYNRIENEAGMSMVLASAKGETDMHVVFSSQDDLDAWINVLDKEKLQEDFIVNLTSPLQEDAVLSTTASDNENAQKTSSQYSAPKTQEQRQSQSTPPPAPKKSSTGKTAAIIICIAVVLGVCIGVACIIAVSSNAPGSGSSQDDGLVQITIISEPSDATVTINGVVYGTTPLIVRLPPSTSYSISVEKSGYDVYTIQKDVEASDGGLIKLILTKSGSINPTKAPTVVPTKTPTTVPTQVQTSDKKKAAAIADAIQPNSKLVKNLALSAIKNENSGRYNLNQVCDIYDYLYENWTYVNNPKGGNNYTSAGELTSSLKGDCDDFAILIASCIESIGGDARVIVARNSNNEEHVYAEVLVSTNDGKYMSDIANDISDRYNGATINWHEQPSSLKTTYWLNLDWSEDHPGGKFFTNDGTILIVYPDGSYERLDFTVHDGY